MVVSFSISEVKMRYLCSACGQMVRLGAIHYCPALGGKPVNMGGPAVPNAGVSSRPKRHRRRVDPLWPYDTP